MFSYKFLTSYKKLAENSFEKTIRNGFNLLEERGRNEIFQYIEQQQTSSGGFTDKAGKADVYYTFFGFLLCRSLNILPCLQKIKSYLLQQQHEIYSSEISEFCRAIMYKELIGDNAFSKIYSSRIKNNIPDKEISQAVYSNFLKLVYLQYSGEYRALYKLLKKRDTQHVNYHEKPTVNLAAETIVSFLSGKDNSKINNEIISRFSDGGFSPVKGTGVEDLLSTSTALYALSVTGFDMRLIKSQCYEFINLHYERGGFFATVHDTKSDIEYTFYGLLALGALNKS